MPNRSVRLSMGRAKISKGSKKKSKSKKNSKKFVKAKLVGGRRRKSKRNKRNKLVKMRGGSQAKFQELRSSAVQEIKDQLLIPNKKVNTIPSFLLKGEPNTKMGNPRQSANGADNQVQKIVGDEVFGSLNKGTDDKKVDTSLPYYCIINNREVNKGKPVFTDGEFDSDKTPVPTGADASMAQVHQFLIVNDTRGELFNIVTFGLNPETGEVDDKRKAEAKKILDDMNTITKKWGERFPEGNPEYLFHMYPTNSVHSLHLHMIAGERNNEAYIKHGPSKDGSLLLSDAIQLFSSM